MSDIILKSSVDPLLKAIAQKVINEERITPEEGIILYEKGELGFLGSLATLVRNRKNKNFTYFNKNIHIEPTNVCIFSCRFCSYSKDYKHREDGWELTIDEMLNKVRAYPSGSITEVHVVGGVHPKMDLHYFAGLLKEIKNINPSLHIKAFTAVELDYMFRKAKMTNAQGLQYLKDHGLDSIPGGGAEIFDEEIRNKICADKCNAEEWLNIHQEAHQLNIPSNATMLYGHYESYSHRVDHMNRLRNLQDKTKGFQTFIPLKFRNKDNEMSHLSETTQVEDLKNYAVARIFLDNFQHVKAYWPMIGRATAQLSQNFGVDDMDGTIDDTTRIYTMAGSEEQNPTLTTQELVDLISQNGFVAVERDTLYNHLKVYENVPVAN
ncbi:MAG TPA: aminofutalosine synthase MqnE [Bacteroidia bacterium]|nr:aminofutalosine synthase MqnE [Bacteroidia bacterium]MBP7714392.1 aminofutalosine synthase MqnE [Bacteroidia bacterium]HOZ83207.1 aminofutalosine synthase MqnE [Bacteroidia bacterium]HOZ89535.1 aminofutalosine synthase MqnE [Bacteroidia bacterium]HQW17675.1 aminofutalosine synthase MqnE [Bacteroidia bacterium]